MTPLRHLQACLVLIACAVQTSSARAADSDKYLPDRTEAVVTINVKQLVESPLLKDYMATIKKAVKDVSLNQPAIDGLGLDPFQDLDRIIIAWPGNPEQEDTFILIQGSFDNAKIDAALQKSAQDKKGF